MTSLNDITARPEPERKGTYTLTLTIEVVDVEELYNETLACFERDGQMPMPEIIGTPEEPDIEGCLQIILDPGVSPPGMSILDGSVEFHPELGDDS